MSLVVDDGRRRGRSRSPGRRRTRTRESGMEITGLVLNSMPLIISSLQFYIGGIATDKRYSRYRDKVQMLIAELRTGHTMCKNAIKIMFTGVLKHNELVEFFADPCAERWRDEKYNRMLKEHLGTNYEPYMEMITHILDTINAFMKRLKLDPSGKPQFASEEDFREQLRRFQFSLAQNDYRDLLDQLRRINSSFDLLSSQTIGIVSLATAVDRKEDLKLLNWLTPIDYGPQQSDYIQRRQPATGEWLLHSDQFQRWLGTTELTLFCPGIPGAGKTILTSIVVEHLHNRFQNDQKVGIAYLYCNYKLQNQQKAEYLLSSLLKQLASQHSLPEAVKSLYDKHERQGTRPASMEISRALRSVSAQYSPVFIIVDALDECQGDARKMFLSEIFALQAECGVNIFATSRPIPEIVNEFRSCESVEIRASSEDIGRYLESRMGQLRITASNPTLQSEIRDRIVNAADGLFLLARLFFDSLASQPTVRRMRTALEEISTGSKAFDLLYESCMERIYGEPMDSKELAMQALLWITCVKRPLAASELQHALAVEVGEPELDEENIPEIDKIVSLCSGFVVIDQESQIIRFAHYSAYEYFQKARAALFPTADLQIADVCVTYLSYSVFGSGFCQTDDEFEDRLRSNKLYDYAAHNWGHHARDSLGDFSSIAPKVLEFLKDDAKLEASTQALMAVKKHQEHLSYSQRVPREMTSLHLAAYFGLEDAVQSLLGDFVHHPDLQDSYGRTPLSLATANGHNTVVERLLHSSSGVVNANLEGKDGRTPLSWAAGNGHDLIVKHLLDTDNVDANKQSNDGRTPLLWAAANGHQSVVKRLIDTSNADPNKKGNDGRTPLLWAAANGHHSVVSLLLDTHKVDANSVDSENQTPILLAAANGHEAVVMLLLKAITNIESGNKDAILSWAVDQRQWGVIEILLRQDELSPDPEHAASLLLSATKNKQEKVVKTLLERTKIAADYTDENERTILSWAAELGQVAIIQLLLGQEDVKVESKDRDGRTPLSRAAENGHHKIVEHLLRHSGTEVDGGDNVGRTPLSWAAEKGHAEVAELLLKRAEVDADYKDTNGRSILSRVSERGQIAILRLLLDRTDVVAGSQDSDGRTPLSWAAENDQWEIVEQLLRRDDARVDCQDKGGQTALSRAAIRGHAKVVEHLLKRTDVTADHMDENNRTILSRVAESGRTAIVRLLLERKDVLAASKDNEGRTPLSWAAESGHLEVVERLLQCDDAEVDCGDHCGCTALHYAAKKGHKETARILTEHVDVDLMDNGGNTALLTALKNNNLDVVRLLVRSDNVTLHALAKNKICEPIKALIAEGYDVDTRDSRYSTPLHEAIQYKSTEVLDTLISSGADINLSNMDGKTPLQLAIDLRDKSSIERLLSRSAPLIGIKAGDWHSAYEDESDVLLLSETPAKGYSIHFISKEEPDERLNWSAKQALMPGREILVHKVKDLSKNVSDRPAHGLMWYREKLNHGAPVYFVDAWFTRRRDIDKDIATQIDLEIVKDWKCSIGWTVSQARGDDGKQCWRTVEHFSVLPYGWIPKNGLDFFQTFFQYLQDYWMGICDRAHKRLFKLRRDVLDGKGEKPHLIGRLLEHARLWAELRQSLGPQILAAENFNKEYGYRFHQEPSKDLEDKIKHFAESITSQIDRLDQTSQDLIQIEFNLVSIKEARISTSTSTSMKRLSWITFIFLPAMFASSLFGMNVNILKDNPDWRWYLLFGGAFLDLTIVGWLLFKYLHIEEWVEKNIGKRLEKWLNSEGTNLPTSG